jgi:hypothetical protein
MTANVRDRVRGNAKDPLHVPEDAQRILTDAERDLRQRICGGGGATGFGGVIGDPTAEGFCAA